jgi:hypothetical protein
MLIALALSVATIALPPLALSVHAAPTMSSRIIRQTLEEAAVIWRNAGVTLVFEDDDCASGPTRVVPSVRMHVTFEESSNASRPDALPIGWIDFDEVGDPMRQVHLSLDNATRILEGWQGVGPVSRMTPFERNMLLARVLGRALAHELGHYLLSSKAHTKSGLMKAHHVAQDFLGLNRAGFEVDASQQALIASRRLHAAVRNDVVSQ